MSHQHPAPRTAALLSVLVGFCYYNEIPEADSSYKEKRFILVRGEGAPSGDGLSAGRVLRLHRASHGGRQGVCARVSSELTLSPHEAPPSQLYLVLTTFLSPLSPLNTMVESNSQLLDALAWRLHCHMSGPRGHANQVQTTVPSTPGAAHSSRTDAPALFSVPG